MDGIKGDFRDLAKLTQAMASLASAEHRLDLAKNLAEEARTQAMVGFQRSVDPYDKPWEPLKSRQGQPLVDTGTHLRNPLNAQPTVTQTGFTMGVSFKGAAVHQYGATIRAKTSKGLWFRVRGAPSKRSPRGKLSGWVTKQQVTIPRRQYMPENYVGRRWGDALEKTADLVVRKRLGVP